MPILLKVTTSSSPCCGCYFQSEDTPCPNVEGALLCVQAKTDTGVAHNFGLTAGEWMGFAVGQLWATRSGGLVRITHIVSEDTYPIKGIWLTRHVEMSFKLSGAFIGETRPSDYDLIEKAND